MLGVIILSIILIISYLCWTRRQRKKLKLPPEAPGLLPIIGGAFELLGKAKNSKDLMKLVVKYGEYCNEYGGVIHGYVGPLLIFGITGPEDGTTVLNTCLEKNFAYEFARPWLGDGLVTTTYNLETWKRHRKIITRSFNQQVLDGYIGVFNKQSRWLVKEMDAKVDSGPFEHFNLLEEMSLGTMYQTTMGFSEDEVRDVAGEECKQGIRLLLQIISSRFKNIWLWSPFIYQFTALKKLEDQTAAVLMKTSSQIIKRKRLALQTTERAPTKFKSFLESLLELPPQEAFTDREIREEVQTMIVAGSDTTATMLTFCLLLLGSHQDIQTKVHEEIQKVLGSSLRDVEKQDLSKLEYLEAVLLESMRLYPILPVIMRYVANDCKLKNCTLPAGSSVILVIYAMHRNTALWGPDAAEFRPERWLPNPPAAAGGFAGFSIGKRGCIGKVYAMMSMKTTLVHVLRHYRVFGDVTKLECQLDTFLKPASGCEISIERRH